MASIKRSILFQSGAFPYAEVTHDGHIDIAGGSGSGKSTLLTAFIFPYLVDNDLLGLGDDKEIFADYYFKQPNSFIFYVIENDFGAEYTAILSKNRYQELSFSIVNATFKEDWLYTDEEKNISVISYAELEENIKRIEGNSCFARATYNRTSFNRMLLGVDDAYSKDYSIMKQTTASKLSGTKESKKDTLRPLMSVILKNKPLSQTALKESLVSAVVAETQSGKTSINLLPHRKNLSDFIQRKHDIELATIKGKDGKSQLERYAEKVFEPIDQLSREKAGLQSIPGLISYAMNAANKKVNDLTEEKTGLEENSTKITKAWELKDKEYEAKLDKLRIEQGAIQERMNNINARKKTYAECDNIDNVYKWACNRSIWEADKTRLEKQLDEFEASEENRAIEDIRNSYRKQQTLIDNERNNKVQEINKEIAQLNSTYKGKKEEVELRYEKLFEEEGLLDDTFDLVIGSVRENTAAGTLTDVSDGLLSSKSGDTFGETLIGVITKVRSERIPSGLPDKQLSEREKAAIADYTAKRDRKAFLEKRKHEEIKTLEEEERTRTEKLDNQIKEVNKNRNKKVIDLKSELEQKIEETKAYYRKLRGNDKNTEQLIAEINEELESAKHVLEELDNYPKIISDYEDYLSKEGDTKTAISQINKTISTNSGERAKLSQEKNHSVEDINSKIKTIDSTISELQTEIGAGNGFIKSHPSIATAIEEVKAITTDSSISNIINDYNLASRRIEELEKAIPGLVRGLYAEGMLHQGVDTFALGIGYGDSLSSLDDFIAVSDRLRDLLQETSSGETVLENHIRTNEKVWLGEFAGVMQDMVPVEENISLLMTCCRKANAFLKKYNNTDVCQNIEISIDEQATVDIMILFREMTDFWKTNGSIIGNENLFISSDAENVNKQALDYLERLHNLLESYHQESIPLEEMFDVKLSVTENGNVHRNMMRFNNVGSRSTAILCKAMINMTLMHLVANAGGNKNVYLPIPIDEMNDISTHNLKALTYFAEQAHIRMIFCGQHHTHWGVDYSYNTWTEDNPNGGTKNHFIELDAEYQRKEEEYE